MDVIDFSNLKFKERDEVEDVFSSWYKCHAFDIEKLRDQRLRHHFQTRYDHRKNAVDWDYQFGVRETANIIQSREYNPWRINGIAFEARLSSGVSPNRTLGSYVSGKKKRTGDSIMVRGFWGDVLISPFVSFGVDIENEMHKTRFYRRINMQPIYGAADISEYSVQMYACMLETMAEYKYPFERLKGVLKDYGENLDGTKIPKKKK